MEIAQEQWARMWVEVLGLWQNLQTEQQVYWQKLRQEKMWLGQRAILDIVQERRAQFWKSNPGLADCKAGAFPSLQVPSGL